MDLAKVLAISIGGALLIFLVTAVTVFGAHAFLILVAVILLIVWVIVALVAARRTT